MNLASVMGCCTATYIDEFESFHRWNEKNQLKYLTSNEQLLILCEKDDEEEDLGQCLLFTILTDDQAYKIPSLQALGFQCAISAPKDGDDCRHKDSGNLNLWWVQPWVLNKKRLELIEQLQEKKMPQEEKDRRLTFPEFRLTAVEASDVWKEYNQKTRFPIARLRRANDVPVGPGIRTQLKNFVSTLTGGYDFTSDDTFMNGNRTFGDLKDRAILYREGRI